MTKSSFDPDKDAKTYKGQYNLHELKNIGVSVEKLNLKF
jgi:hypothetical protein